MRLSTDRHKLSPARGTPWRERSGMMSGDGVQECLRLEDLQMKCEKCFEELYECPDCKGQTRTSLLGDLLTCSTCRSTGKLCPKDGGFWER